MLLNIENKVDEKTLINRNGALIRFVNNDVVRKKRFT